MTDQKKRVCLDCDAGRKLGCRTFCCRLLVRLKPHEMKEGTDGLRSREYVDKDEDGMCVHMDRETWKCRIWEERPEICREYDCNNDFLLQVAIRREFVSVVDLIEKASTADIPEDDYIQIPALGGPEPAPLTEPDEVS